MILDNIKNAAYLDIFKKEIRKWKGETIHAGFIKTFKTSFLSKRNHYYYHQYLYSTIKLSRQSFSTILKVLFVCEYLCVE